MKDAGRRYGMSLRTGQPLRLPMTLETWGVISTICINKVSPSILRERMSLLTREDIARIAALGVPYYSFSISWSRILPFGRGTVNELALQHYDDVINTCLKYGVKPVVTLYHVN